MTWLWCNFDIKTNFVHLVITFLTRDISKLSRFAKMKYKTDERSNKDAINFWAQHSYTAVKKSQFHSDGGQVLIFHSCQGYWSGGSKVKSESPLPLHGKKCISPWFIRPERKKRSSICYILGFLPNNVKFLGAKENKQRKKGQHSKITGVPLPSKMVFWIRHWVTESKISDCLS